MCNYVYCPSKFVPDAMKSCRESWGLAPFILNFWHCLQLIFQPRLSASLLPMKESPVRSWVEGWVGLRAWLVVFEEDSFCYCNRGHPIVFEFKIKTKCFKFTVKTQQQCLNISILFYCLYSNICNFIIFIIFFNYFFCTPCK